MFVCDNIRIYISHNEIYNTLKGKRNEAQFRIQQTQIETLKSLENSGYIDLYFGDQSHFGGTPNVPYAWQTMETPILLPAAKGKSLSVVGLMTRKNELYLETIETTFNSGKIICFMEKFVEQTLKKTVIILDNSPIHKSKKFMAKIVLFYFVSLFFKVFKVPLKKNGEVFPSPSLFLNC